MVSKRGFDILLFLMVGCLFSACGKERELPDEYGAVAIEKTFHH